MNDMYYDTQVEGNGFFDDGEYVDEVGEEFPWEDYYGESPEAAEADHWLDDPDAFEMAEADYYAPGDYMYEDYIPEGFEEYEPESYDDFGELAESLREVLHEDYFDATPEELEQALSNMLETMTSAEGFNFGKILSQIGKAGKRALRDPTISGIAKTVLPVAGGAVGTFFGGPLGTALGGKLGQAAAGAFTGGRKSRTTTARARRAKPSPRGGSAAATQLLQLTQNPDMLKGLLTLALGSHGRKSIRVGKGGPSVPVGGLMNLLSSLASKAAADADELLRESEDIPAYLLDSEGEFVVDDPADPGAREQVLYEALLGAENQRLFDEVGEDYAGEDYYEPEMAEARYPYWY